MVKSIRMGVLPGKIYIGGAYTVTGIYWFMLGLVLGVLLAWGIFTIKNRGTANLMLELLNRSEESKEKELAALRSQLKDSFSSLSMDALSKNTQEFLKLAGETLKIQTQSGERSLEEKKSNINSSLENMNRELLKVEKMVSELEKDREQKFGEINSQLKAANEQTLRLLDTTSQLKSALAGTKQRGMWGERMAEDVLRVAGFIEGVNYFKQKSLQYAGSRPDFTFLLPSNLVLNMDVKFPADNYLRHLEEERDTERDLYRGLFLKDVRNRIKEVTTRDYINPEDHTVDYVLVFIPNEHIFAFIQEHDQKILDHAMANKVVLCSPVTLYAILAVIRHAVDNFKMEQTATEIISLLGAFHKQWEAFSAGLDKMGKRIEDTQKEYHALATTRRNQLEKPLRKIEELRARRAIEGEENIMPPTARL